MADWEIDTWRKGIEKTAQRNGDRFEDLVHTLSEEELDYDLDDRYGPSFTAWSENFVYFPARYDGRQWVESVPRNPCGIKTKHVGGSV